MYKPHDAENLKQAVPCRGLQRFSIRDCLTVVCGNDAAAAVKSS